MRLMGRAVLFIMRNSELQMGSPSSGTETRFDRSLGLVGIC
jgi:hypothetical protein